MRVADDVIDPHHPQHAKPDCHHRAEESADLGRAVLLEHEQPGQNHDRDGNHHVLELRRHHLQTFDGRQHRDSRRDHAIAVKHGRAEYPGQHDPAGALGLALRFVQRQGDQRHHAALAAVVGAQNEYDVFERDDDHQRPENHRQTAKHVGFSQRNRVIAGKEFLEGVQRTRADIPIHHAQRTQDEQLQARLVLMGRQGVRRCCRHTHSQPLKQNVERNQLVRTGCRRPDPPH